MRTYEQLRHHFEVERELAAQLKKAPRRKRLKLYKTLYDELFSAVPDHPQLCAKRSSKERTRKVRQKLRLLRRFLWAGAVGLEVGAGDCALARAAAKLVREVYAVEISKAVAPLEASLPRNLSLIISDGVSIPVPQGSVDVAWSDQLMEHLHPDDATAQLQNIFQALHQGGAYVCFTPNRISGPHDISQYFESEPQGLHLKEYTVSELTALFQKVGFKKIKTYVGGQGFYLRAPQSLLTMVERILEQLPLWLQKRMARTSLFRALLGVIIVGVK